LSFVNNGELFCYQAITSGGVVLILPGFLIRKYFLTIFTLN
jgi:hypothetical protein